MKQKGRTRLKNRKLVFGVGINDSDYVVRHREFIPGYTARLYSVAEGCRVSTNY